MDAYARSWSGDLFPVVPKDRLFHPRVLFDQRSSPSAEGSGQRTPHITTTNLTGTPSLQLDARA
jgi:hypothetical protein